MDMHQSIINPHSRNTGNLNGRCNKNTEDLIKGKKKPKSSITRNSTRIPDNKLVPNHGCDDETSVKCHIDVKEHMEEKKDWGNEKSSSKQPAPPVVPSEKCKDEQSLYRQSDSSDIKGMNDKKNEQCRRNSLLKSKTQRKMNNEKNSKQKMSFLAAKSQEKWKSYTRKMTKPVAIDAMEESNPCDTEVCQISLKEDDYTDVTILPRITEAFVRTFEDNSLPSISSYLHLNEDWGSCTTRPVNPYKDIGLLLSCGSDLFVTNGDSSQTDFVSVSPATLMKIDILLMKNENCGKTWRETVPVHGGTVVKNCAQQTELVGFSSHKEESSCGSETSQSGRNLETKLLVEVSPSSHQDESHTGNQAGNLGVMTSCDVVEAANVQATSHASCGGGRNLQQYKAWSSVKQRRDCKDAFISHQQNVKRNCSSRKKKVKKFIAVSRVGKMRRKKTSFKRRLKKYHKAMVRKSHHPAGVRRGIEIWPPHDFRFRRCGGSKGQTKQRQQRSAMTLGAVGGRQRGTHSAPSGGDAGGHGDGDDDDKDRNPNQRGERLVSGHYMENLPGGQDLSRNDEELARLQLLHQSEGKPLEKENVGSDNSEALHSSKTGCSKSLEMRNMSGDGPEMVGDSPESRQARVQNEHVKMMKRPKVDTASPGVTSVEKEWDTADKIISPATLVKNEKGCKQGGLETIPSSVYCKQKGPNEKLKTNDSGIGADMSNSSDLEQTVSPVKGDRSSRKVSANDKSSCSDLQSPDSGLPRSVSGGSSCGVFSDLESPGTETKETPVEGAGEATHQTVHRNSARTDSAESSEGTSEKSGVKASSTFVVQGKETTDTGCTSKCDDNSSETLNDLPFQNSTFQKDDRFQKEDTNKFEFPVGVPEPGESSKADSERISHKPPDSNSSTESQHTKRQDKDSNPFTFPVVDRAENTSTNSTIKPADSGKTSPKPPDSNTSTRSRPTERQNEDSSLFTFPVVDEEENTSESSKVKPADSESTTAAEHIGESPRREPGENCDITEDKQPRDTDETAERDKISTESVVEVPVDLHPSVSEESRVLTDGAVSEVEHTDEIQILREQARVTEILNGRHTDEFRRVMGEMCSNLAAFCIGLSQRSPRLSVVTFIHLVKHFVQCVNDSEKCETCRTVHTIWTNHHDYLEQARPYQGQRYQEPCCPIEICQKNRKRQATSVRLRESKRYSSMGAASSLVSLNISTKASVHKLKMYFLKQLRGSGFISQSEMQRLQKSVLEREQFSFAKQSDRPSSETGPQSIRGAVFAGGEGLVYPRVGTLRGDAAPPGPNLGHLHSIPVRFPSVSSLQSLLAEEHNNDDNQGHFRSIPRNTGSTSGGGFEMADELTEAPPTSLMLDIAGGDFHAVSVQENRGDRLAGIVMYGTVQDLNFKAGYWMNVKEMYEDEGTLPSCGQRAEGYILEAYRGLFTVNEALGAYEKDINYDEITFLGSGVSGRCYLAKDKITRESFCIKIVDLLLFDCEELIVWSGLKHPNVVTLYGAIRKHTEIHFFSQYIEGTTLKDAILQQRGLNTRLALWYMEDILRALVYLQQMRVVHEDLKADNIMLRNCGSRMSCVVIDFGVSRKLDEFTPCVEQGEPPIGAPTHWSPEKARSEEYSYGGDVWAAFCNLIHMLAGTEPWVRRYSDKEALLYMLGVTMTAPLEDLPQNTHSIVRNFVSYGMNVNCKQRPTAQDLLSHPVFQHTGEDSLRDPGVFDENFNRVDTQTTPSPAQIPGTADRNLPTIIDRYRQSVAEEDIYRQQSEQGTLLHNRSPAYPNHENYPTVLQSMDDCEESLGGIGPTFGARFMNSHLGGNFSQNYMSLGEPGENNTTSMVLSPPDFHYIPTEVSPEYDPNGHIPSVIFDSLSAHTEEQVSETVGDEFQRYTRMLLNNPNSESYDDSARYRNVEPMEELRNTEQTTSGEGLDDSREAAEYDDFKIIPDLSEFDEETSRMSLSISNLDIEDNFLPQHHKLQASRGSSHVSQSAVSEAMSHNQISAMSPLYRDGNATHREIAPFAMSNVSKGSNSDGKTSTIPTSHHNQAGSYENPLTAEQLDSPQELEGAVALAPQQVRRPDLGDYHIHDEIFWVRGMPHAQRIDPELNLQQQAIASNLNTNMQEQIQILKSFDVNQNHSDVSPSPSKQPDLSSQSIPYHHLDWGHNYGDTGNLATSSPDSATKVPRSSDEVKQRNPSRCEMLETGPPQPVIDNTSVNSSEFPALNLLKQSGKSEFWQSTQDQMQPGQPPWSVIPETDVFQRQNPSESSLHHGNTDLWPPHCDHNTMLTSTPIVGNYASPRPNRGTLHKSQSLLFNNSPTKKRYERRTSSPLPCNRRPDQMDLTSFHTPPTSYTPPSFTLSPHRKLSGRHADDSTGLDVRERSGSTGENLSISWQAQQLSEMVEALNESEDSKLFQELSLSSHPEELMKKLQGSLTESYHTADEVTSHTHSVSRDRFIMNHSLSSSNSTSGVKIEFCSSELKVLQCFRLKSHEVDITWQEVVTRVSHMLHEDCGVHEFTVSDDNHCVLDLDETVPSTTRLLQVIIQPLASHDHFLWKVVNEEIVKSDSYAPQFPHLSRAMAPGH